ncbi:hypothetical protein [Sinobaca sp. H24]|uniref:hypothetical protein n=1 Tax=Sinobaca sp. H24 TaxID=2923376 RepID=UPI0020792A24|nr:hypothetical protein [Sinobaca sp. H24]
MKDIWIVPLVVFISVAAASLIMSYAAPGIGGGIRTIIIVTVAALSAFLAQRIFNKKQNAAQGK